MRIRAPLSLATAARAASRAGHGHPAMRPQPVPFVMDPPIATTSSGGPPAAAAHRSSSRRLDVERSLHASAPPAWLRYWTNDTLPASVAAIAVDTAAATHHHTLISQLRIYVDEMQIEMQTDVS